MHLKKCIRCSSFRENLPDQKALAVHLYYQWFEPAVDKWLDLAKFKVISISLYNDNFTSHAFEDQPECYTCVIPMYVLSGNE